MTAPSTDDLISRARLSAQHLHSNPVEKSYLIAELADRLEAQRKAAEGMAEALRDYEEAVREHIATEFPNSAWIPVNLKEAIDQGKSSLAAYEELKP
jgi:hypothetical protein